MLKKPNCPVIAIEEHYSDSELLALFTGRDAFAPPHVLKALQDTGEARLQQISSLEDVQWALLESGGRISFIPKSPS